MLCYKDRTFCASDVKTHTCGRELTKEDKEKAEKPGLPIAYGNFCEEDITKSIIEDYRETFTALHEYDKNTGNSK
jgi:hypothetical protein